MTAKQRFLLLNRILLSRYAPVGGQAVIEGVMMRSPRRVATAVQRASGEIVLQVEPFRSITKRIRGLGIPVVRGMVGLVETLILGVQSLSFSANEAAKDEEAKETAKKGRSGGGKDAKAAKEQGISTWSMTLTMLLAFGLGLLVFFYLPLKLTEWTGVQGRIAFNLIDGAFRLVFFLAYLWGISRWSEMRRLFQYHGAEHKVIHTFEAGLPVTPEHAAPFTTLHPRCGTSFLFSLMILSIVVFTFFGRPETLGDRLLRFAGIPFIAGLGFEYIRLSGKHADNPVVRFFARPGLWLQLITTKEPDRQQLAVACRALESVLPLNDEDEKDVRMM
jgi:uncharacterized protein YqhQ